MLQVGGVMEEHLTGHLELIFKSIPPKKPLKSTAFFMLFILYIYYLYMDNKSDKYNFVYDNKTNNWFIIDTQSSKYKFYAKISKGRDWFEPKKKSQLKIS